MAHSPQASVLIRPPFIRSDDYLVAAKISSKEQFLAVSGALVGKETMLSIWRNVTESLNISDHLHLYWLDEGGHVIATNQMDIQPGTFIGSKNADPQVSFSKFVMLELTSCNTLIYIVDARINSRTGTTISTSHYR